MTLDINSGVEPPGFADVEKLQSFVNSFPNWYQRIYLGGGLYTLAGTGFHELVWERLRPVFPPSLAGASVLDVGSNAGYFCLQAKLNQADEVFGVEVWPDYMKQAEAIRDIWGLDISYVKMEAHRIGSMRRPFDLVIFTGMLYHLKNPFHVIETLGRLCVDAIIVETEVIIEDPRNTVVLRWGEAGNMEPVACRRGMMKFVEGAELNSDSSNWWVPDAECVFAMLRASGFNYFSRPVYLTDSRLLLVASKNEQSRLNKAALA